MILFVNIICSKHHLSQAEALLDSHKKRKVEDQSSSREKSSSSRKNDVTFCDQTLLIIYNLGHHSAYSEGSSRSHSDRNTAISLSSGSYRTVVDAREKEKRSERSRGDHGNRKSRSGKKEKDKSKERKRFDFLPG